MMIKLSGIPFSDDFAKSLGSDYLSLSTGEHFLDREGYFDFPLVFNKIKRLFAQ